MNNILVQNNIPIDSENDTVDSVAVAINLSADNGSCFSLPLETAAAIATAIHLSGKAEEELPILGSGVAAAIGAALFLHLVENTARKHENIHKEQMPSLWSQYGRANAQNSRLQVFNRTR